MKRIIYNKFVLSLIIIVAAFIYFSGCTDKGSPSLWVGQPVTPVGNTPVVSSIEPVDGALAGVSTITITGQNFSANSYENLVYFNGLPGNITSSTSTQISVISPNLFGNSIEVKVAVTNAELFSNIKNYKLMPAVAEFYAFDNNTAQSYPYGLATDKSGNVYSSLIEFKKGTGISKIGIDSSVTPWAPKGGETFFNSIKFGPNNTLYAARKVKALFIVEEGVKSAVFVSTGLGSITDFDFDQNGNIWAGGASSNGNIYLIKPDKSITPISFSGEITSIKVFEGNLYVASSDGSQTAVWKMQINGEALGTPEKYFDFSANYPIAILNAIAFAADGDMYLGTDLPGSIIVVHADKTFGPLYSGLFAAAPAYAFASGPGNYLYYTRSAVGSDPAASDYISQTIIRINLGKPVAVQYGRD